MENPHFGKLSPEPRNIVYMLVLPPPLELTIQNHCEYGDQAVFTVESPVDKTWFALGNTCRSLRIEYLPMLYANVTWTFHYQSQRGSQRLYDFDKFREQIGEANAATIQHLILDIGVVRTYANDQTYTSEQMDPEFRDSVTQLLQRARKERKPDLKLVFHFCINQWGDGARTFFFKLSMLELGASCGTAIAVLNAMAQKESKLDAQRRLRNAAAQLRWRQVNYGER